MSIDDTLALVSARLAAYEKPDPDLKPIGSATARKRFAEGWINLDGLKQELSELGYTDGEITRQVLQAAYEYSTDWLNENLAILNEAFQKDVLLANDYIESLVALGMERTRANTHLQQQQIKRSKRASEITAAQVLTAYQHGILDTQQSTIRLVALGYPPQDIPILLKNADFEPEAKARRLSESQVLSAYAHGLVDAPTARSALQGSGYSQADIDLLLELATRAPSTPVAQLSHSEILEAYAKGILGRDQAVSRLQALGYSPGDIAILLELKSPTPTPIRTIA